MNPVPAAENTSGLSSDELNALQSSSDAKNSLAESGELIASKATCTFNDREIGDGNVVLTYQNSTVSASESCAIELRTCNNGILDGSYNYATCKRNAPRSCLFNGKTIAHGETVMGFKETDEPNYHLKACAQAELTCNDGNLAGSDEFALASCTPEEPHSCMFNGRQYKHGEKAIGFNTSTKPFPELCTYAEMYCVNGKIEGANQFPYPSCQTNAPKSCNHAGRVLAHGEAVVAFNSPEALLPNSCASATLFCNNGQIQGASSYPYASCTQKQLVTEGPYYLNPPTTMVYENTLRGVVSYIWNGTTVAANGYEGIEVGGYKYYRSGVVYDDGASKYYKIYRQIVVVAGTYSPQVLHSIESCAEGNCAGSAIGDPNALTPWAGRSTSWWNEQQRVLQNTPTQTYQAPTQKANVTQTAPAVVSKAPVQVKLSPEVQTTGKTGGFTPSDHDSQSKPNSNSVVLVPHLTTTTSDTTTTQVADLFTVRYRIGGTTPQSDYQIRTFGSQYEIENWVDLNKRLGNEYFIFDVTQNQ
jgi:hypothetical protein